MSDADEGALSYVCEHDDRVQPDDGRGRVFLRAGAGVWFKVTEDNLDQLPAPLAEFFDTLPCICQECGVDLEHMTVLRQERFLSKRCKPCFEFVLERMADMKEWHEATHPTAARKRIG